MIVPWDVAFRRREPLRPRPVRRAQHLHGHPRVLRAPLARGLRRRPVLPAHPSQYRLAFAAFHQRWPYVKTISPWNEANHPSQPTAITRPRRPSTTGRSREVCPELPRARRRGGGHLEPRALAQALQGRAAEHPAAVGAAQLRRRHAPPRHDDPAHAAHRPRRRLADRDRRPGALPAPRRLASRGPTTSSGRRARSSTRSRSPTSTPRISRVYLYNWRSVPWLRWDSALLSAPGEPRPSFYALAARLRPGESDPGEPARGACRGRAWCAARATGAATAGCWRPSRVRVRTSSAAPS